MMEEHAAANAKMEQNDDCGPPDADDWHSISRENKKKAGLFVCVNDLQERLVTSKIAISAGLAILFKTLRISSIQWENFQRLRASQGQQRSYLVLEYARNAKIQACRDHIESVMLRVPTALNTFTLKAKSKLFRSLSALLCNVEASSGRYQRYFPFCLFKLLDNDTSAYDLRTCLRDDLACEFFSLFPTKLRGVSNDAKAWLQSLAAMIETDISDVECLHSSVREFTKMRGRGHIPRFSFASAQHFIRWVANRSKFVEQLNQQQQQQSAEQQSQQDEGDEGVREHVRRPGGGGAWRAFCAERSSGKKLSPTSMKQLAADYRALGLDEHQYFVELGQRMTLQSRWARNSQGSVSAADSVPDGVLAAAAEARASSMTTTDQLLQLHDASSILQLRYLGKDFNERLGAFSEYVNSEKKHTWVARLLSCSFVSSAFFCYLLLYLFFLNHQDFDMFLSFICKLLSMLLSTGY